MCLDIHCVKGMAAGHVQPVVRFALELIYFSAIDVGRLILERAVASPTAECSHVTSRPWRSRVLPFAKFEGFRKTVKLPSFSSNFMMRLLGISLQSRYPPSGK